MKSDYKRYALVGPGGLHCPCCHSKSDKHRVTRQGKRRFAAVLRKLIESELAS